MTNEQAIEMLGKLGEIKELLIGCKFLLAACGVACSLIWGAITWRLILLAKNESQGW